MSEKLFNKLSKKLDKLKSDRANFDSNFRTVAKYFRPSRDDINTTKTNGDKSSLFENLDSMPIVAVETLASIFNGIITNRSTRWFEIVTEDENILQDDNTISEWLNDATNTVWNLLYSTESNFEQCHSEILKDLFTIGTVASKIEEGEKHPFVFLPLHIKNYYIAENAEGKVDYVVILSQMDAYQMVDKWGDGKGELHEKVLDAYKNDSIDKFDIELHIYPRKQRDKQKIDILNMAFAGIWIDRTNKKIIQEVGFNSLPVAVARSEKNTGEVYGTSRAMLALADAKQLQRMWADYNTATERNIRPPLIVNAMLEGVLDISPLALIHSKGYNGTRPAVEPVITSIEFNSTKDLIEKKTESIKNIFFLDKLKVIENPNATATQVLELRAEGFRIMSSIAISIQEYLEVVLDRVLTILMNKSYANTQDYALLPDAILKEIPESLKGQRIKIKFVNPINEAQQITVLNSIDVLIQTALNIAQVDPSVLEVINFDEVIKKKANIMSIDPKIIRGADEIQQIRDAKRQQELQMQQVEQDNLDSQTIKNLQQ